MPPSKLRVVYNTARDSPQGEEKILSLAVTQPVSSHSWKGKAPYKAGSKEQQEVIDAAYRAASELVPRLICPLGALIPRPRLSYAFSRRSQPRFDSPFRPTVAPSFDLAAIAILIPRLAPTVVPRLLVARAHWLEPHNREPVLAPQSHSLRCFGHIIGFNDFGANHAKIAGGFHDHVPGRGDRSRQWITVEFLKDEVPLYHEKSDGK
ncbi:unnamed protein product [Cyclocybe aegerita]|uniref:Uncharacterized protein n=1 Tax=Cyclocybe aegerita TaxID=1973307 RepID=A0A8S0VUD7_CYCAE|nr:unnamed protein product [Cyclocybe aegerita]